MYKLHCNYCFSQDPRTGDCAIFIQGVVPGSTAEKVTLVILP